MPGITDAPSRLQIGLDDLIRSLEASDDPIVKQLVINLGKMQVRQKELKEESRETGGGHSPSSYAAVCVGGVMELITDGMFFEDFDESKLSEKQREFFDKTREAFPGIVPRELEEDGSVIFHGQGKVCRIKPDGKIEAIGDAPDCPHCADSIMGKIDRGYTVAQCDHCGNALRDLSGGSDD